MEPNIIATRQRRTNAGNKLQSLLQAQDLLADDDIFQEVEGDDEFQDLSDTSDVRSDVSRGASRGNSPKDEVPDNRQIDDLDFSDSGESSHEEEPENAGEIELVKEVRAKARKEREKQRQQLRFPIEKIGNRSYDDKSELAHASRPKRKVSEILLTERRSSKRSAAVRSKQELLERIMEQESRQIEAPVVKRAPVKKLTQEERLQEAQWTEKKNAMSLNRLSQLEESRKQKQRAAMLARRPQLVSFIRYYSCASLVPPLKPKVPVPECASPDLADIPVAKDDREEADDLQPKVEANEEAREEQVTTIQDQQANEEAREEQGTTIQDQQANEEARGEQDTSVANNMNSHTEPELVCGKQPSAPEEAVVDHTRRRKVKYTQVSEPVEGPDCKVCVSQVELLAFEDEELTNKRVRQILLGDRAVPQRPELPIVPSCIISGKSARYLHPGSGLYYYDKASYKVINDLVQHTYRWSPAFGCYYATANQRHAAGVPEGFQDPEPC